MTRAESCGDPSPSLNKLAAREEIPKKLEPELSPPHPLSPLTEPSSAKVPESDAINSDRKEVKATEEVEVSSPTAGSEDAHHLKTAESDTTGHSGTPLENLNPVHVTTVISAKSGGDPHPPPEELRVQENFTKDSPPKLSPPHSLSPLTPAAGIIVKVSDINAGPPTDGMEDEHHVKTVSDTASEDENSDNSEYETADEAEN